MKKVLLIIGAVAVAGYVVYTSYFAVGSSAGSGYGTVNGGGNPLPTMPTTEEQKFDALNSLRPASSVSTSTVGNSAGNQTSDSESGAPKSDANTTNTMEDERKIKLLESLRR